MTLPIIATYMNRPAGGTVSGGGGGSISLSWTASADADGYVGGWDSTSHAGDDPINAFLVSTYPNRSDFGNVTSASISPGSGTWYISMYSYIGTSDAAATERGPWDLANEISRTV